MEKVSLVERETHVEDELPKVFNKTKEEVTKDVKMLQEWMKTQPHLPEIMDFLLLRQLYINNKCSIEVTKKKVDIYYTIRSKMPYFFEGANPKSPQTKRLLDNDFLLIGLIPKLTKDMNRIIIIKMENMENATSSDIHNLHFFHPSLTEVVLRESYNLKYIIIVDLSKIDLNYAKHYSPTVLHQLMIYNERAVKYRIEAIYVINLPLFANVMLEVFKKCLPIKILERMHFCDEEFIRNRFPKEMLPEDYGGEQKSIKKLFELVKLKLSEYQERFDQLDKMKVDENLRPEKLENDDFLGFFGNFKKLEVD